MSQLARKSDLSHAELLSLVIYEPETGVFYWREPPPSWRGTEPRADIVSRSDGYRLVTIHGSSWRAHRLAFLYMTGALPALDVDHIDGDKANNRWANLREVTHVANMRNVKLRKDSESGVHGVFPIRNQARNDWRATIGIGGKSVYLGQFPTMEEAIAVRREAEKAQGYHPNHGRPWQDQQKNLPRDVTLIEFVSPENQDCARVTSPVKSGRAISWHEVVIWETPYCATVFGNPISVTRSELRVLELLVSAQGLEVSRQTLWESLYTEPFEPESRRIDVFVARLREILGFSNTLIQAVKGAGYRLDSKSSLLASIIAGNRIKQINFGPQLRSTHPVKHA